MINNLGMAIVGVVHKLSNTLDNNVSNGVIIIDFKSLSIMFKSSGCIVVDWWCVASAYDL